jgi:hypothetical protein
MDPRSGNAPAARQDVDCVSVAKRMQEADAIRHTAAGLLQEQRDEVKRMNSMVLKGQCMTIRDAQVRTPCTACTARTA